MTDNNRNPPIDQIFTGNYMKSPSTNSVVESSSPFDVMTNLGKVSYVSDCPFSYVEETCGVVASDEDTMAILKAELAEARRLSFESVCEACAREEPVRVELVAKRTRASLPELTTLKCPPLVYQQRAGSLITPLVHETRIREELSTRQAGLFAFYEGRRRYVSAGNWHPVEKPASRGRAGQNIPTATPVRSRGSVFVSERVPRGYRSVHAVDQVLKKPKARLPPRAAKMPRRPREDPEKENREWARSWQAPLPGYVEEGSHPVLLVKEGKFGRMLGVGMVQPNDLCLLKSSEFQDYKVTLRRTVDLVVKDQEEGEVNFFRLRELMIARRERRLVDRDWIHLIPRARGGNLRFTRCRGSYGLNSGWLASPYREELDELETRLNWPYCEADAFDEALNCWIPTVVARRPWAFIRTYWALITTEIDYDVDDGETSLNSDFTYLTGESDGFEEEGKSLGPDRLRAPLGPQSRVRVLQLLTVDYRGMGDPLGIPNQRSAFVRLVRPGHRELFRRFYNDPVAVNWVEARLALLEEGASPSKGGVPQDDDDGREGRLRRLAERLADVMPTEVKGDDFTPMEIMHAVKGVRDEMGDSLDHGGSFFYVFKTTVRYSLVETLPPLLADFLDDLNMSEFLLWCSLFRCSDALQGGLLFGAIVSAPSFRNLMRGCGAYPTSWLRFFTKLFEWEPPRDDCTSDQGLEGEFSEEGVEDWMDLFAGLKSSPLSIKVAALVSSMWGFAAFTENKTNQTDFINENLTFLLELGTKPLSVVEAFLALGTHCEKNAAAYAKTKNPWDLFGKSKALELLDSIRDFLARSTHVKVVRETVGLRALIDEGNKLVAKAFVVKELTLSREMGKLIERLAELTAGAKMTRSMPPVGFIMTGPPGTGKTQFCQELHIGLRQMLHPKDPDISVIHFWTNTNFQALPAVVQFLVFNDIMTIKDEFQVESEMVLLQRAVDVEPCCAEGASLPEKANSLIEPCLVGATTNSVEFEFAKSASGANKLDRRFWVIWTRWSRMAKAQAKIQRISPADLLKARGSPKGLVEYKLGRMTNDTKSNKVSLALTSTRIDWTENRSEILSFLLKEVKNRKPILSEEPLFCGECYGLLGDCSHANVICLEHRVARGFCGCPKVFCGHLGCFKDGCDGSHVSKTQHLGSEPQDERLTTLSGEVPFREDSVEDEEEELLGRSRVFSEEGAAQSTSAPRRPKGMFDADVNVVVPPETQDYVASIGEALATFIEAKEKRWAKGAVVGLGSVAVFAAVLMLAAAGLRRLIPEGIVRFVENVPKEKTPLFPYSSTTAAWLGGGSKNYVYSIERPGYAMQALAMTHRMFAVPQHFFTPMKSPHVKRGDLLVLRQGGLEYKVCYNPDYVVTVPGRDVAFLFTPAMNGVSGIGYSFLPEEEAVPKGTATFKRQEIHVDSGFQYPADSEEGDCGLPIEDEKCLYGFHVGKYENGIRKGVPLSRRQVRWAMEEFQKRKIFISPVSFEIDPIILQGVVPGLHPKSNGAHIARVTAENCPDLVGTDLRLFDHVVVGHLPSVDKPNFSARRSEMFDVFGSRCAEYGQPWAKHAVLVDGEWLCAERTRLEAMRQKPFLVDRDRLLWVTNSLIDEIPIPPIALHPLSLQQAMAGDDMNVLVKGRDTSKSCGVTLAKKGVTKETAFVKTESGEYRVHPLVLAEIELIEAELQSGVLKPAVVKATAKDELYPVKKAKMGKKRYFYVGDLAFNMVVRKLTLPVLAWLMANPRESGCVTTMNAGSPQWGELLTYLTRFGPYLMDSDQSGLDNHHGFISNAFNHFMYDVSLKCGYTQQEARMVVLVLLKAERYLLFMEGNLFVVSRGLVSGLPFTITLNCVVMKLMFYYTIAGVTRKVPSQVTSVAVTGDDSLLGVDDELEGFISPELVTDSFASCGYEITAPDKESEISFVHWSELKYLKRRFRKEGGRVFAPLELDSVFKSLAYVCGIPRDGERERSKAALQSAAREMFLHGEEAFLAFVEEAKDVWRGLSGGELSLPTYGDCLQDFDAGLFTMEPPCEGGLYVPPLGTVKVEGKRVGCDHLVLGREQGSYLTLEEPKGFPSPKRLCRFGETRHFNNFSTEINDSKPLVEVLSNDPIVDMGAVEADSELAGRVAHDSRRPTAEAELAKLFARPIKLFTFPAFSTASLFSTWKASVAITGVVPQWQLFRGNARVRIQYSGSPSLLGVIRFYFVPRQVIDNYSFGGTPVPIGAATVPQTFELPHVDIDLSLACACEIDLPWPKPYTFLTIASESDWDIFELTVTPLQRADGLTVAIPNIDVYVSYHDVELETLTQQGKGDGQELPPGPWERALAYGSLLAARFPGPHATAVSMALRMGSAAAGVMGWARPPEVAQSVMVMKKHGSLALASGQPDFSSQLGTDPGVSRNVKNPYIPMAASDDTMIYPMSQKWCQLSGDFDITKTVQCVPGIVPGVSAAQVTYYPTRLAFFAWGFRYWTGTLKYKIVVNSSPLVRGRLGIHVLAPGAAVPGTFKTNGSVLSHIVEVAGTTEVEFEVPFLHKEPWRAVTRVLLNTANTNETRLAFYWLTPSSGPATTAITLPVSVFVAAGKDYQLAIPTGTLIRQFAFTAGTVAALGAGFDEEGRSVETFGEVIEDIRLLMKRPTHNSSVVVTTTSGQPQSFAYPCDGFPRTPDATVLMASPNSTIYYSTALTNFQYFRMPYFGYSGGSCIKIMLSDVTLSSEAARTYIGSWDEFARPGFARNPASRYSDGADVFQFPEEAVFEMSNPDRCLYHFKNPSYYFPATIPGAGMMCYTLDALNSPSDGQVIFDIVLSARDDLQVGGWLCVPVLYSQ
jgi:hypothetical protein